MKKVFAIFAIAGIMVACGNKSDKKIDAVKDSATNMLNNMADSAKNMMNNAADSGKKMIDKAVDSAKSKM